ncbi:hypothetical protein [Halalkalicoccus jeotgali]|uniref:Uncharacterized protein n=1 Tax=Halalkalicoccus jeotgali (strain DSM 18796 / CECT 7217 / JCM 14584 / KCTC 4019 / B3) TaxID=795797 RepID=D8J9I2_HALJB|nr:hypothetical protein [Halalkalicoccus jeotgali]ADJ14394.1 hypothetical protein HacjB3_05015 [Halalkalicoccus jeotgali B3]ELY40655.1 hypothetical protein C497_03392 [Halalkalicoccus jeotgali B3]
MANSLDEIETTLAEASETEDDDRAHERLERAREELAALEDDGSVDEERAEAIEAEIDQHLRAIEERDSYDVDAMGAAREPDDETA